MAALELLLWTCGCASRGGPADELPCDGLPFEHIVAKLRTSTLNAYGDFHVRFRIHYESLPPYLTMIVVAKPRATAAVVIESVVRQFAVARPCCIGRYFGRELQPAFQKAVADAHGGPVDLTQLIEEFDVIQQWSVGRNSTAVCEKLHKANKDVTLVLCISLFTFTVT